MKSYPGGRGRGARPPVASRVDDGEFVVLEGPSGSGKSTTLHLIAALDRPTSGTIRVHGRDVAHRHRLDRYRREEVGVIFQLHNLLPHLDALQNVEIVMLGGKLHRSQRRDRGRASCSHVGRARRAGRACTRRSCRAASVSASPSPERSRTTRGLLLADEPTGSLDDDTAALVIDLLRDALHARRGGARGESRPAAHERGRPGAAARRGPASSGDATHA